MMSVISFVVDLLKWAFMNGKKRAAGSGVIVAIALGGLWFTWDKLFPSSDQPSQESILTGKLEEAKAALQSLQLENVSLVATAEAKELEIERLSALFAGHNDTITANNQEATRVETIIRTVQGDCLDSDVPSDLYEYVMRNVSTEDGRPANGDSN